MIKILKQCVLLIFILTEVLYCTNTALDSALTDIKNKYSVVGMSVLVTSADSVVYSGSFGMRNLEQNLPVNGNTCYRIASISKMVTATALFQLFEQGLFKLDDDVSNFLGFDLKNPNYPDQPITFHQLLSHTGSLRDGSGYSNFLNASYNNTPPPKIKELLQPDGAYYSSDMFSNTKAPQDLYFQYANINYGIIGTLIERLSGLRFDIYCRQNIFEPLGIKGSFNIQDIDSITNVAVLYRKSGSNWVPQVDDYGGQHPPERDLSGFTIGDNGLLFAPQGGLRISAEDLSLFMRAHQLGGGLGSVTILQDTTTARMHETFWQYTGSNGNNYYGIFNNYAAGNHLTESLIPSQSLRGHPGEAYGLISDMYFCKIGDYGIILITNGGLWGSGTHSGYYNIEEEIFEACYAALPDLHTSALDDKILPKHFQLFGNYPNPFNNSTTIMYEIDESGQVQLELFNLLGQKLSTLVSTRQLPGIYQIDWDASDFPSGIYLYRLRLNSDRLHKTQTNKLLLQK